MRELKCLTIYLILVLCGVFFMSLYLFTDFFLKITQESFGADDLPKAPDELQRPVTIAIFCLTFLSIGTYSIFMLGIHKLNTHLMIPWAVVIGFKCIAGGVLLIFASSYVSSWTLLQGLFYYSTTIITFIAIYVCYVKIVVVKKKLADRLIKPEKLSIICVTDEKPKTIV